MNFRESIFQSLESLKANKIRSFLTLLALVIGVFSVIVSTTAVAVLDNFFTNTLSILGSNVITVQRTPAVQMGSLDKSIRNRKSLRFEDAERLEDQIDLAEGLAPLTSFSFTSIKFKDKETDPNISVRGSNGEFIENNAFKLQDGRNITEEDLQYKRNVVILGKDIQTELFENEYPLNKEVRIDGQPYLVIGLLEKKGEIFGSSFDDIVIIPYTTGINVYGGKRGIGIQVRAPEINRIQDTIEEITGIMRVIRGVGPLEENDFEVTDKINVCIEEHPTLVDMLSRFGDYIKSQTLTEVIELKDTLNGDSKTIELDEEISVSIQVKRRDF